MAGASTSTAYSVYPTLCSISSSTESPMQWDQFTLEQHGDSYERLWGHFLRDHFPEWERFWAHHVVPLTNRIDPEFSGSGEAKLFIRDDPGINAGVEALMMANYSVFY